jgi:hypothetical protein
MSINFSVFYKLLSKFLLRMSLAMYAAPFDNDSLDYTNNDSDNIINKKRQTHNKTQKKYPKDNFDQEKVNTVLEKIHNNLNMDEADTLANFSPPPNPESVGVLKTIATEEMQNMTNENMFRALGKAPSPNYVSEENFELNNFNSNYADNKTAEDYYKKFIPGYTPGKNPTNKQYYNSSNNSNNSNMLGDSSNELLLKKINYMINLLEEHQDERTNNVTEEVVLYSFLGIFIIFVVDSFARVGKYIR